MGLFQLTIPGYNPLLWGSQDRNSKHHAHHTMVKSRENTYIMYTHLFSCALIHFLTLVQFRTPCLGNGAAHTGLGLPTSLIQTVPHTHPHRPTLSTQILTETLPRWFQAVSSWQGSHHIGQSPLYADVEVWFMKRILSILCLLILYIRSV